MTDVEQLNGEVPDAASGMRLDRALAQLFPDFSRSRLKTWIEAGLVTVNGEHRRPRDAVYGGEQVSIEVEIEPPDEMIAQAMPMAVLYQDADLMVINKPAGLVVHPGAGNPSGTLVNGLLHYDAQLHQLPRAGLIHRLDKDTSGVLVVARTLKAHTALSQAMQARTIKRSYLAVCAGRLSGGGSIDQPIGRHDGDRTRMAVRNSGRSALTHYRLLERFRGNTLLSVQLETGRTHQIRVHLAFLGHPLVGDRVYGRPSLPRGATVALREELTAYPYQALHAHKLEFEHPVTGVPVSVSTRPPPKFRQLVEQLREDAKIADNDGA